MNITFVGAGNMAEAIVAGIISKKVSAPEKLTVTDISDERLAYWKETYGVGTSKDNAAAAATSDVIVLAVKPQVFETVWPEIDSALKPDALVISIMAGVTTKQIAKGNPIRVVRVMPNTPSLVGEGAAGIAPGEFASDEDIKLADTLMSAVGTSVTVKESEIDAVTALSGSGPAYVFYLLESMLEAAEQMGLEKETARKLALATVSGGAKLMKQTGEDADVLRRKVTSKGGTTEAALRTMDEHGVKASIVAALRAAEHRSKELADG